MKINEAITDLETRLSKLNNLKNKKEEEKKILESEIIEQKKQYKLEKKKYNDNNNEIANRSKKIKKTNLFFNAMITISTSLIIFNVLPNSILLQLNKINKLLQMILLTLPIGGIMTLSNSIIKKTIKPMENFYTKNKNEENIKNIEESKKILNDIKKIVNEKKEKLSEVNKNIEEINQALQQVQNTLNQFNYYKNDINKENKIIASLAESGENPIITEMMKFDDNYKTPVKKVIFKKINK